MLFEGLAYTAAPFRLPLMPFRSKFTTAARTTTRHRHGKRPIPGAFVHSVIAHRGVHFEAPENSLEAFAQASRNGLPIELDVRQTQDGVCVVFHDGDTERMTGSRLEVSESSLEQLKALHLRKDGAETEERIPTLDEVLEVVRTPILLELKQEVVPDHGLEKHVLETLKRHQRGPGDIIIESFNPFCLGRCAELEPDYIRVQLTSLFRDIPMPRYKKWLLRTLMFNGTSRPDAVAVEQGMVTPRQVRNLKRKHGYGLLVWTAKSPRDVQSMLALGADAVIADIDAQFLRHMNRFKTS